MICSFQDPLRYKCPGCLYNGKELGGWMDGCAGTWMFCVEIEMAGEMEGD